MSRVNETRAAPDVSLSAPRFAMGWAALAYALAALALAYPAFTGQVLLNPHSDQYIAGYAFREFAASALKAGQGFPQWNPFLFGGMPYIAAMHGDIFYPTFLLRMAMPADQALTWSFVIHLVLAGLFTFGFLRAWGVGFYGALVGGLAYMLSGPIAGYASPGHDGKLYVSALLPLALWMIVRGVRDGRAWAWGVLAITIGLAVLSPHPQLLQYLLLTTGAFALLVAFGSHNGAPLPRRVALQRLGLALGAVILGAVIGAVQYLPVREYVPWSPRAGGKGWEHAVSYSMPVEELFNAVVPQFSGILENYWGRNGIHLHSEYAGVVVLILAGAGMFATSIRRNFRWFWLGTFIVSLLWTLGGNTPFYHIVYAIVPGTKYFRAPSTMMFVTMFSLSVFAALGVERVLREGVSRRFVLIWGGSLLLLGVIMAAGLPQSVAESLARAYGADDIARRADANQGAVLGGVVRSLFFGAAALAVLWLAAARQIARRAVPWMLAGLVALDLWSIERMYWRFSPPAKQLFATDPAIDSVRASRAPGRVLALDLADGAAGGDEIFNGDALMVHRVRSVLGYHGNQLGRYDAFNPRVNPDAGARLLRPELWRHENVQWLYTTVPDTLMAQVTSQLRWPGRPTRVAGPVRNSAGSMVYLYRLPGDNPAAWVATLMVKGTDDQALGTVLDPRFDPLRAAIIDTAAPIQAAQPTTAPPPSSVQARVTRLEPGAIDVELVGDAANGAALVVSENFFPGWHAQIDGRDVATVRANYNLIGVPLTAAAKRVTLRFVDAAYETGKTVTLVALAIAIAAVLAGIVVDRRTVPAATPRPATVS